MTMTTTTTTTTTTTMTTTEARRTRIGRRSVIVEAKRKMFALKRLVVMTVMMVMTMMMTSTTTTTSPWIDLMRGGVGVGVGMGFFFVSALPAGFVDEGIISVVGPTGLAFAKDRNNKDVMLVGEIRGRVWMITDFANGNGNARRHLVLDLSKDTTKGICKEGERGLGGVEFHPDFKNKGLIFLYYTAQLDKEDGCANKLVRYKIDTTSFKADLNSEKLFLQTDVLTRPIHNGGDMEIGKNDGHLYVTVGDGDLRKQKIAQDLSHLSGKVVRLTIDGDIPKDNPYNDNQSARCHISGKTSSIRKCREIYAYGFRNPFRFAQDPDDGKFYINDVGGAHWEEISLLKKGKNYGWPLREGPCRAGTSHLCSPDDKFEEPTYWYPHNDQGGAVVGGAFPPDGLWPPEYNDAYLFADFPNGKINVIKPSSDDACRNCSPPRPAFETKLFHEWKLPVSLVFGPHENSRALYYTSRHGSELTVRRVVYRGGTNRSPKAVMTASQTKVDVNQSTRFDASGSSDPDGDNLTYNWDFGDGNRAGGGGGAKVQNHTFRKRGTYTVTLTVEDGRGAKTSTSTTIRVGLAPTARILRPKAGETFSVGDVLTLEGEAFDIDGTKMNPQSLEWEIRQHHNTHWHPYLKRTTGNNLKAPAAPSPEDYLASTNSHLRVILRVNDDGVETVVERDVMPNKRLVYLETDPPGLELMVDDFPIGTPKAVVSWDNHPLRVYAPNKPDFVFTGWKDSGGTGRSRTILVGNGMPTIVANFDFRPGPALDLAKCTLHGKCGRCEGNCRSNTDCVGPLVCSKRDTAGTPIPNCKGQGSGKQNYCTLAPNTGPPKTSPPPPPPPPRTTMFPTSSPVAPSHGSGGGGGGSMSTKGAIVLLQQTTRLLENAPVVKNGVRIAVLSNGALTVSMPSTSTVLWNTWNFGGASGDYFAVLQSDCNLLVRNGASGKVLWRSESGLSSKASCSLALLPQANPQSIAIVRGANADGKVLWNTPLTKPYTKTGGTGGSGGTGDTGGRNKVLLMKSRIDTLNENGSPIEKGDFKLSIPDKGVVTLTHVPSKVTLWKSGTVGDASVDHFAKIQSDCNFIIRRSNDRKSIWRSGKVLPSGLPKVPCLLALLPDEGIIGVFKGDAIGDAVPSNRIWEDNLLREVPATSSAVEKAPPGPAPAPAPAPSPPKSPPSTSSTTTTTGGGGGGPSVIHMFQNRQIMKMGSPIVSGGYKLELQKNGKLRVSSPSGAAVWFSKWQGTAASANLLYRAQLQGDCNFVIRHILDDGGSLVKWNSAVVVPKSSCFFAVLPNSEKVAIVRGTSANDAGAPIWEDSFL